MSGTMVGGGGAKLGSSASGVTRPAAISSTRCGCWATDPSSYSTVYVILSGSQAVSWARNQT